MGEGEAGEVVEGEERGRKARGGEGWEEEAGVRIEILCGYTVGKQRRSENSAM